MRKITCLLLLLQSGFMIAQTKTVVTQYGEKITISPFANNGLTANNGYIQLGGALTQPSVLTTTSAYTLAIMGLQTGGATDNILVADANGVLKTVSRASLGGADNLGNHVATQNLEMSNYSISNIKSAYVKNEIQFADRLTSNTNYFSIYKNNGLFGIWNSKNSRNELSIDETTGKTNLTSAAIAKGTNGSAPAAGYIATSLDASGNVVWEAPSVVAPVGYGFFKYTLNSDVSIPSNSGKVKFNKKIVDRTNVSSVPLMNNDLGYSVFVVPKTGYYNITVAVYSFLGNTGTCEPKVMRSVVYINNETTGGIVGFSDTYAYTNQPYYWTPQLVVSIEKYNVGDRISVGFNNNFSAQSGISADTLIAGDPSHSSVTYFSGYFISE